MPDRADSLSRLTSLSPMTWAGSSGTPLVARLGLRDGQRVLVLGRPRGMDLTARWQPTPVFAALRERAGPTSPAFDLVVAFCPDRAALARRLPLALTHITTSGTIWIVWPKKSGPLYAGPRRGITEDDVRGAALAAGVVDVKVCAFDDAWSALKLVYRLKDRHG
jgi:hypothetical protein